MALEPRPVEHLCLVRSILNTLLNLIVNRFNVVHGYCLRRGFMPSIRLSKGRKPCWKYQFHHDVSFTVCERL